MEEAIKDEGPKLEKRNTFEKGGNQFNFDDSDLSSSDSESKESARLNTEEMEKILMSKNK